MKVTIIGAGNMGGSIAKGLAQGTICKQSDITCCDKSGVVLNKLKEDFPGINITDDNLKASKGADIIILAVKPWYIESVLYEIKSELDYSNQIIVSIAAGITFEQLTAYLTKHTGYETDEIPTIFRVMPNTAIAVRNSMTFVAASNATEEQSKLLLDIFKEVGDTILIEEHLMSPGTALASCGIAFALRYIRAAMEGGVELGFYPEQAQQIVTQTIKGAVELLEVTGNNPEIEIDKVTTPGGLTIKGLNEMENAGFTSAVIRGLKASM